MPLSSNVAVDVFSPPIMGGTVFYLYCIRDWKRDTIKSLFVIKIRAIEKQDLSTMRTDRKIIEVLITESLYDNYC